MTTASEKTPKDHGSFFFSPVFSQWKEDALRNRERLVKETFWGQSAAKVRASLKLPVDQPLIFSGHQPVFFHPGLWAKCLAASLLAESVQGMAFHKITDTALAPEHIHHIPEIEDNGKARCKPVDFFHTKDLKELEKVTPYAFLPAPDTPSLERIFGDIQVFSTPSVKKNAEPYLEKFLKARKNNPTWDDFHVFTMRMLDEGSGTKRSYMAASKLWTSDPFLEFLTYWLTHLSELTEQYNKALDEYRLKNGIQHELTPMPNLRFENWWFEIPFWAVTKYHQRHSLWAKQDGKHFLLRTKGSESTFTVSMDDFQRELAALPIMVWPKAMPQTLFCRMYLADYFIHGTGGAVYEEVNDIFFENVFKVKALSFGVVTATYYVEPQETRGVRQILHSEEKVKAWGRALAQNPEYLFTRPESWRKDLPHFMQAPFEEIFANPTLKSLADQKGKWVLEMASAANKAEIGKKIKEVNFALYDRYTEVLKTLEQGLLDAEKVRTTQETLEYREYPFFCYPRETFVEMKEKMRLAAHPE